MTTSISRPVPASFFLQHITEFGDEVWGAAYMLSILQLEIEYSSCLKLIWQYNGVMFPTARTLQRQQHDLRANAWFLNVSRTCWVSCNWNQHYEWNAVSTGLCFGKGSHTLMLPRAFWHFWVSIVLPLKYVQKHTHTITDTLSASLVS